MEKTISKRTAAKTKYVPYTTERTQENSGGSTAIFIIGAVLATIFAAPTAYSGMKAGLTVAAGISGSIIGSGLVGVFARKKGLFGKNLLQGMSSGGESIASGMIYVLPAIIIIGGRVNFLPALPSVRWRFYSQSAWPALSRIIC